MGDQPSKLECFLAELGRRHVVKVAVAYAAVAFVVLQLGEIILPAFSAEWALQYLVVFAVLGFPLVMVLAWVFDITPEGIRKTDAIDALKDYAPGMSSTGVLPRLALLVITLLAVGGLGWWWVESAVEPPAAVATVDGGPTVVPVAYDPNDPIRSLAVLPLDNFSDTGEQDYFAAGMHGAHRSVEPAAGDQGRVEDVGGALLNHGQDDTGDRPGAGRGRHLGGLRDERRRRGSDHGAADPRP